MRPKTVAFFIVTIVVASAAQARTKDVPERQMQEQACFADAMRLCSEFIPDEDKITACMDQKQAQLSPPCAAMFKSDK